MAGALMTMPMLVINMGAEMVYVLDQRLKAQNIPREKSAKGERGCACVGPKRSRTRSELTCCSACEP